MRRVVVITSVLVLGVAGVLVGGCAKPRNGAGFGAAGASSAAPTPTVSPSPSLLASPSPTPTFPTLRAPEHAISIKVKGATLFGWALLDRSTNKMSGSANYESMKNTVESMIKGWIAADFLRRKDSAGKTPSATELSQITSMIIDSNNQVAQMYYNLDGQDASMKRLISMCGLTGVELKHNYWSYTQMTPADAVRYGECINDGTAAGPTWTSWLLGVMKKVRGGVKDQVSDTKQGGRWGIVDGLPKSIQGDLSMKNGWTKYRDGWHVNCLGIEPGWVLAVMLRTESLPLAAADCASVTRQLVVTH